MCCGLLAVIGNVRCVVTSFNRFTSSKLQHFSKCMLITHASRFQPKGFALALESSTAASPAALGCASWLLHRQLGLPLSLLPALGWRLCRTLRFRASFGRSAGPQTPLDIAGRPHMITCKMWHARLRPCRVASTVSIEQRCRRAPSRHKLQANACVRQAVSAGGKPAHRRPG